jgi:hypothetical protein
MTGTFAGRLADLLLRNATAIIFIVVFVFFGLQSANFFGAESIGNIVKQASFTGVIAVGMIFVLLTAGIDLSVGSNMYLSAMAAGYFLQIPAMQVVSGRWPRSSFGSRPARFRRRQCVLHRGAAHNPVPGDAGDPGRRARPRHGHHRILRHQFQQNLHRPRRMVAGACPRDFGWFASGPDCRCRRAADLDADLRVRLRRRRCHIVLTRTPFGRQIYAVGNDIDAAKKAGIDTRRIIFSVYVISGPLRLLSAASC